MMNQWTSILNYKGSDDKGVKLILWLQCFKMRFFFFLFFFWEYYLSFVQVHGILSKAHRKISHRSSCLARGHASWLHCFSTYISPCNANCLQRNHHGSSPEISSNCFWPVFFRIIRGMVFPFKKKVCRSTYWNSIVKICSHVREITNFIQQWWSLLQKSMVLKKRGESAALQSRINVKTG